MEEVICRLNNLYVDIKLSLNGRTTYVDILCRYLSIRVFVECNQGMMHYLENVWSGEQLRIIFIRAN